MLRAMKRVTWLLALPIAAATLLLAACDRTPRAASTATSAAPTAATAATLKIASAEPVVTRTPIARPVSTVTAIGEAAMPRARFVVQRRSDLWIVSPASPARTRLVVSSEGEVEYGGTTRKGDLYYAVRETGQAQQDGRFAVYRVSLEGGPPVRLFDVEATFFWLTVSSDGSRLAYAVNSRERGLAEVYMQALPGGAPARLLSHDISKCFATPRSFGACLSYATDSWSADGRYLAVRSNAYEWSEVGFLDTAASDSAIIRPSTSAGRVMPAGRVRWHPTLPIACATLANDGPSWGAFVFDLRTRDVWSLDLGVPVGDASVNDCAWSPTGDLSYSKSADQQSLLLFGADYEARTIGPLPGRNRFALPGWLPDGTGMALAQYADVPRPPFSVLGRSGTLAPLNLDADTILDILPE